MPTLLTLTQLVYQLTGSFCAPGSTILREEGGEDWRWFPAPSSRKLGKLVLTGFKFLVMCSIQFSKTSLKFQISNMYIYVPFCFYHVNLKISLKQDILGKTQTEKDESLRRIVPLYQSQFIRLPGGSVSVFQVLWDPCG